MKENIRQLALNNLGKQPTLLKEKQKLAELHAELTEIRDQYKTIRGQYGRDFPFIRHRNF